MNDPKSFPLPSRGEIWIIDWNPGRGSEQEGIRPALIVQTDLGNHSRSYPNTIVLAITTKERNIPQHIRLEPNPRNGLKEVSYIMTEQVMPISKSRLIGSPIGTVESTIMKIVREKLIRVLEL